MSVEGTDSQAKGMSSAKSLKEKKFKMSEEHQEQEYRWRTVSEKTNVMGEVDTWGQIKEALSGA